tara:strand:+ start:1681 stop:1938 length:258 start_codon:yes stop_codon:yes gene_type:complete
MKTTLNLLRGLREDSLVTVDYVGTKFRRKMETNEDSLKIHQNEDGSFAIEWDKNDPRWNFMNGLTSQEITDIVVKAIKEQLDGDG